MPLIEWSDHYCIGVESIDQQHRQLVDRLNTLQDAVEQQAPESRCYELFKQLAKEVNAHFSHEEALFEQSHYPELQAHHREHEVLLGQIATLDRRYPQGELLFSTALLNFLRSWLIDHMLGADRRYAEYLRNPSS